MELSRRDWVLGVGTVGLALLACSRKREPGEVSFGSTEPEKRSDGSVILSKPGAKARRLRLHGDHGYWLRGHRRQTLLQRAPKAGGKTVAIADVGHNASDVALDDQHAFIASWHGLLRAPLAGGKVERLTKARVNALALTDSHVVFATKNSIEVVPKAGGSARTLAGDQGIYIVNLGVDGDDVYWVGNQNKTLQKITVGGGPPTVVARDLFPADAHDIFFDAEALYLFNQIPNRLIRIEKASGKRDELGSCEQSHFRGFAADASHIYYGRGIAHIGGGSFDDDEVVPSGPGRIEGKGGVMRLPKAGAAGPHENLCRLTRKVTSVAVDDTHVFWLDTAKGHLAACKKA